VIGRPIADLTGAIHAALSTRCLLAEMILRKFIRIIVTARIGPICLFRQEVLGKKYFITGS
jgi:hypothetical protein